MIDLGNETKLADLADAFVESLPCSLALPLMWTRHMPVADVLRLSVEKLFRVRYTALEREAYEHQDAPLQPLRVPVPLWSATIVFMAAYYSRNCPDSELDVVASQFPGMPVFEAPDGLFWSEAAFRKAVFDAKRNNGFARGARAWEVYVRATG